MVKITAVEGITVFAAVEAQVLSQLLKVIWFLYNFQLLSPAAASVIRNGAEEGILLNLFFPVLIIRCFFLQARRR